MTPPPITHLALSSSVVEFSEVRHGAPSPSPTSSSTAAAAACCTACRFTVPPGQVTGLLGPSGSGKTTLMRAIVGVQQVRSGEVTVLGEPAGSPGLRSRVGYVTQAPSVYDDLTVRENARYFAALYGMSAREADAAIADVGPGRRGRPAGARPLRRPAGPGLAGLRPGRQPRGAGARRADRRAGPGAAGRALGAGSTPWPPPGRR